MSYGVKAYKSVGIKDDIAVADPHRLIQLLMQGALENLAKTKGFIERKNFAEKSKTISKAITIIAALQQSLDMKLGGEISENLYALYDFMVDELTEASRHNNMEKIDVVMDLLLTIKSAWDQIPVADREQGYLLRKEANGNMVVGL